ncbi:hypothetical protein BJ165DRAFT_335610 [Panaeolus papilionaceus]|nr:hypothetical protein BJ165DRAFT_335610 [Panaeolus papilionaceus]
MTYVAIFKSPSSSSPPLFSRSLSFPPSLSRFKQNQEPRVCPPSKCVFRQFYAKRERTCVEYDVFISTGIADEFDVRDEGNRQREKGESERDEGRYTFSTPATSPCIVTATKNVFWSYTNGVERGEVCWRGVRAGRDALGFESSYLGGSDEMNSGIYDDTNPESPT